MSYTVDRNLLVNTEIGEKDVRLYSVKEEPFDVYGLYRIQEGEGFRRLPDEIGLHVNEGVAALYTNTAGGRVRFCTDSSYVAIQVTFSSKSHMPHMPLVSSAGLDLYLDDPVSQTSTFCGSFMPPMDLKEGYTSKISFPCRKKRYFTINFPSYSSVKELFIGLQADAVVGHGLRYLDVPPIVYYGSSITQGGCSSRPGTAYQNIIARRNHYDFVNLGFSGSARGEESIARYMASLPMSVFVCDYDHNSPFADLPMTHKRLYQIIREKNPNLPYLILTRPDFNNGDFEVNQLRRDIIFETYRQAREAGDQQVYFLDGAGMFACADGDSCTVDGVHPNDYGFFRMAEAIDSQLRWIFTMSAKKG